jgi:hypothetical protein
MMYQFMAYEETYGLLEIEEARLAKVTSEIAEIKASIEDFQKEKAEFAALLFDERDVPAFLDQVSTFAQQASVGIVDMKTKIFRPVVVPKDLAEESKNSRNLSKQVEAQKKHDDMMKAMTLSAMPIHIRVKGTFASFVQFLDYFQEYKQLVNINNVEIKAADYPMLESEFIIHIYALQTSAGS